LAKTSGAVMKEEW